MIVGIGGYAESGKDAFADAMVQHNPLWSKTYMSYSLEKTLLVLDPYVPMTGDPHADLHLERYSDLHARVGYDKSKKNPETRRLLQVLGTEVGREMFGENVWVDKMLEIAKQNEFTLVTGIRYRNEIDAVIANQGVTAWVSRPGVRPINAHTSDNTLGVEDFAHEIVNDGSLHKLSAIAAEFSDYLTSEHRPKEHSVHQDHSV